MSADPHLPVIDSNSDAPNEWWAACSGCTWTNGPHASMQAAASAHTAHGDELTRPSASSVPPTPERSEVWRCWVAATYDKGVGCGPETRHDDRCRWVPRPPAPSGSEPVDPAQPERNALTWDGAMEFGRREAMLRRCLERLAAANAVAGPDAATDQLLVDICDALGEEPHPETLARIAAREDHR